MDLTKFKIWFKSKFSEIVFKDLFENLTCPWLSNSINSAYAGKMLAPMYSVLPILWINIESAGLG